MAEFISQQFEHGILGLGNVACGKHISYTSFEADNIETKATHQSVLCIRYQSSYLFWSSSQATDTLGLATSQYSLSLRLLKLTNS